MWTMPALRALSPHRLVFAMVSRYYDVIGVRNCLRTRSGLGSFGQVDWFVQFGNLLLIDVTSDIVIQHRVAKLLLRVSAYCEHFVEF